MPIPIPVPIDSKPYEKAVEVFGQILKIAPDAVGRVYTDWIGPLAEARKIRLLGKANADVDELKANVLANIEDRALDRKKAKEIQRQENLEDILYLSAQNISVTANENRVDEDWLNRFSDIAQDVSKQELKNLWAKILAGEIKQPGKFSLRTLEVLKNITSEEAKLFIELCKLSDSDGRVFVGGAEISLSKYGIHFFHILMLQEAGLVLLAGQDGTMFQPLSLDTERGYWLDFGSRQVEFRANEKHEQALKFYKFSRSGDEISTLIDDPKNYEFIEGYVAWLNRDRRLSAKVVEIPPKEPTTTKHGHAAA